MTPVKTKKLIFPKLIRLGGVGLILLIGLWYVGFQARYLISGPQLKLVDEPEVVQGQRIIRLKGATENITALYLNGRQIATNQAGHFDEGVVLENGYTIISLDARDRYGRTIRIERPFVYIDVHKTARENEISFSN